MVGWDKFVWCVVLVMFVVFSRVLRVFRRLRLILDIFI